MKFDLRPCATTCMNAPKVAGYATGDETPFVITFVGRKFQSLKSFYPIIFSAESRVREAATRRAG